MATPETTAEDAPPATDFGAPFPIPNTPDWHAMNRRRGHLIDRRIDGVATGSELAELGWPQERVSAAADRAFPRPTCPTVG